MADVLGIRLHGTLRREPRRRVQADEERRRLAEGRPEGPPGPTPEGARPHGGGGRGWLGGGPDEEQRNAGPGRSRGDGPVSRWPGAPSPSSSVKTSGVCCLPGHGRGGFRVSSRGAFGGTASGKEAGSSYKRVHPAARTWYVSRRGASTALPPRRGEAGVGRGASAHGAGPHRLPGAAIFETHSNGDNKNECRVADSVTLSIVPTAECACPELFPLYLKFTDFFHVYS